MLCPHTSSSSRRGQEFAARQWKLEGMRSKEQQQLGSGQTHAQMLPLRLSTSSMKSHPHNNTHWDGQKITLVYKPNQKNPLKTLFLKRDKMGRCVCGP